MDNGHVIPSLNEDWSFAGAKLMEWMAGLMAAMLVSLLFDQGKVGQAMPLLVATLIGTALFLSTLRRRFPDEERGVRNLIMTVCGFPPPGIPAPSRLQPRWSGGRMLELSPMCLFKQLELDQVLERVKEEGFTR